MPIIDLGSVPDEEPITWDSPPPGTYECECANVEIKTSGKTGREFFELHWRVKTDGEHKGKLIKDTVHFTESSLPRLKFILGRIGYETDTFGEFHVRPDSFLQRTAYVTCKEETYTDKDTGEARTGFKVPYGGYARTFDKHTGKLADPPPSVKHTSMSAEDLDAEDNEAPF